MSEISLRAPVLLLLHCSLWRPVLQMMRADCLTFINSLDVADEVLSPQRHSRA